MTLERRGEHWYGTEAADIDAFLLGHRMPPPEPGAPHRVVHARCGGCGGTVFVLLVDEGDLACRLCRVEGCPEDNGHYLCGCERYYQDDTEEDSQCLCGGDEFEVAVGFSHTLVALDERAEAKSGKVVPMVDWIYVAARCVACGLIGVYADWHERDCESPEHFYSLV
jgi:hypothetical protein